MSGLVTGAILVCTLPIAARFVCKAGTGAINATKNLVENLRSSGESINGRNVLNDVSQRNCSEEMKAAYNKIQEEICNQRKLKAELYDNLAQKFAKVEDDINSMNCASNDFCGFANERELINNEIRLNQKEIKEKIKNTELSYDNTFNLYENKKSEQAALLIGNTVSQSEKKAFAEKMLDDAKTSIEMLSKLGGDGLDSIITIMNKAHDIASKSFENELYEAAFANAKAVVRNCNIAFVEKVNKELEIEAFTQELLFSYETLIEEMEAVKQSKISDEPINIFAQGKYDSILQELQDKKSDLKKRIGSLTENEIKEESKVFETKIEPKVRRIINRSGEMMVGYYRRIHIMTVVSKFMKENGYTFCWDASVGDDKTQKLVFKFIQENTGNTVVITLDDENDEKKIINTVMQILTCYDGNSFTDAERTELLEKINKAMDVDGIKCSLSCCGDVSQSSDEANMTDVKNVKNMQVRTII